MDILKQPAHPQSIAFYDGNSEAQTSWGVHTDFAGFTKLELASLMIAQGMFAAGKYITTPGYVASYSIEVAKAVLEEANK